MEKPPDKGAEEVAQNHGTTFVLRKKGQKERKPLQGYSYKICLYYRRKVLADIESVLTDIGGKKLLQQFVDGCFGHLLRFTGGSSCGKALHELISREITVAGAQDDEYWFRIGETNIRFAPSEYALVTGLHFGSSSFDPLGNHEMPPEGVFNRLCSGHPIVITELWNMFKQQSLTGSPEDYLKVAHVLALNFMVLGYAQAKKVERWMWALVDDLDAWNRFPWGAYSYRALMHYISILPRNRATRRQYHFYGPVWALQIWTYEAIPRLGSKSALFTRQVTVPRCLNWSFRGAYKMFPKQFLERKLACCVKLEPTDEEKLQPYWLSVQTEQPLGVRYASGQSRKQGRQGASRDCVATPLVECSVGEPGNPAEVPDTDDSVRSAPKPSARPSRRRNRTRAFVCSSLLSGGRPRHVRRLPELLDEAQFVDQVSLRMVDHLIGPMSKGVTQGLIEPMVERLIPHLKQYIDDLFQAREVHNRLQTENRGCNTDLAKVYEKKEEQSLNGGSSSMHISRQTVDEPSLGLSKKPVPENAFGSEEQCEVLMNHPRSGVAGHRKSFVNQEGSAMPNEESQLKQDGPIRAQSDSTEKARIRPPRAGKADPFSRKITTKKSSSTSKRRSLSPSSNEETSDDEGSESSSERTRSIKKRGKKKRRKHSEVSSSESSDSYRHWKRRKRHKRHRASSSESDAQGSGRCDRHRRPRRHCSVSSSD